MVITNKSSPFSKQPRQPSPIELNEFLNRIVDPKIIAESKNQAKAIQNAEIRATRLQESTQQDIGAWMKAKDPARKEKAAISMSARAQQARDARLELARLKRQSAEYDEMMAMWPF